MREAAVLTLVLAISAAEYLSSAVAELPHLWADARLLLVVLAVAVVGIRKAHPYVSVSASVLVSVFLIAAGAPPLISPLVVIVYSVCVYRGVAPAAVAATAALTVLVLVSFVLSRPPSDNITAPLALAFAFTVGWGVRNRRAYRAAMRERAADEVRAAAAEERSRISRELHDVLAHSLSVMVRLADGASAVIESDRSGAQAVVQQIGKLGRESLADVRGLLGVPGQFGTAPQPTLDDLPELVDGYRVAGLPVLLTVSGPIDASEGAQLVIYRTVQESLTNALRHAQGPTVVNVSVAVEPDRSAVVVQVVDDGGEGRATDIVGSRRGLVGLRERAALYGGVVMAGPRENTAGWAVRLRLPLVDDGRAAQ